MKRKWLYAGALAAALVAVLATAGWGAAKSSAPASTKSVSGKISIVGVWSGDEQKSFQAVLNGFKKKFPNVSVSYKSTGDNTPTVLSTAVAGGNPPDLA